jgi:hypothetical protein
LSVDDYIIAATMIYIGVIYLILRLAGQIIMAAVEDDD